MQPARVGAGSAPGSGAVYARVRSGGRPVRHRSRPDGPTAPGDSEDGPGEVDAPPSGRGLSGRCDPRRPRPAGRPPRPPPPASPSAYRRRESGRLGAAAIPSADERAVTRVPSRISRERSGRPDVCFARDRSDAWNWPYRPRGGSDVPPGVRRAGDGVTRWREGNATGAGRRVRKVRRAEAAARRGRLSCTSLPSSSTLTSCDGFSRPRAKRRRAGAGVAEHSGRS
jgi:hypothetical protein